MKKYIVVDDSTTKKGDMSINTYDSKEEAIERAEYLLAHMTKYDKNKCDAFYVVICELDEEGEVDFNSVVIIKEYI